ncbi:MAG: DUF1573 domain-containing protein, partial [Bacteroidia bacterium]|nr:DUF1573 domain-containing protein [Bacteroidia bacterium]
SMLFYKKCKFLLLFIAFVIVSCGEGPNQLRGVTKEEREQIAKDTSNYTYIRWLDYNASINFGTINAGEKVQLIYRFKNVGEKPLFVIGVTETCKCTLTKYNTDPIQPGKQGTIQIVFDSRTQLDAIRKSVIVQTNTYNDQYKTLVFTGFVRDCCNTDRKESDEEDDRFKVF